MFKFLSSAFILAFCCANIIPTVENKCLQKEFEGSDQNGYLKEIIERLISDYLQVPARDLQKQENSVSHSAGQNDNPSFYVLVMGLIKTLFSLSDSLLSIASNQ